MRASLSGVVVTACLFIALSAGAGSASAAELCSANVANPCAAGNLYAVGQAFNAQLVAATTARFTTAGGLINPTITCNTSTRRFSKTANGGIGIDVGVSLTALAFGACASVNPAGCAVAPVVGGLAAPGGVAWTVGFDGTVTWNPSPTITFACPVGGARVNCVFGGRMGVSAAVAGGNPARITYTNAAMAGAGAGCPTMVSFSATYELVAVAGSPTALYVTSS